MPRLFNALLILTALILGVANVVAVSGSEPNSLRHSFDLATGWKSVMEESTPEKHTGFEQAAFDDHTWRSVEVPHNWDDYQGYRQLRHGNLHGTAWYRRSFAVAADEHGRCIFLNFEGVGSYATVWVNGHLIGKHAGGLTSFTLDITNAVVFGGNNILAVRVDHPAGIRDLPWVCGGCERASGFSEGPQPFGIFRPVQLVTTSPVRIEPFGIHVWADAPIIGVIKTHIETELKNYSSTAQTLALITRLIDRDGTSIAETRSTQKLASGETTTFKQSLPAVAKPKLWSPASPYLYTVTSTLLIDEKPVDLIETPFGFRWFEWRLSAKSGQRRLFLNGQPFLINGTADYEHLLGGNFAFSGTQIDARIHQIEAAGFNAFRDAHHPHNLRFQQHWDKDGLLWWTQFGAHVWFDNDAFRTNFKTLLRDWVKERRNSPSLILWGLQNESQLPTAFALECSAIIRELDPTASTQRLITTCNGGTGTDWDVPQNWSGTYSGDPAKYDDDLRRLSLIGEYGAWRSIGLHSEGGFDLKGPLSEDRLCALMETKIRLAEKASADACGHFQWPFTSHANPGRNFGEQGEQLFDGIRPLDRIGPVNNKGLFTIWGEPTDAFYLYRANFVPKETQPMVYLVSHTWPDRWTKPGKKSGIIVYSNCDEVELFNGARSLGRRTQAGRGTHFQWDNVEIDCNLLRADAFVAGKPVATDTIRLHHLPSPKEPALLTTEPDPTAPLPGQHYLYRINCGGPDYTDSYGNRWLADREFSQDSTWGSVSWAGNFGSQRKISDPIAGTHDALLFQSFRFGRNQLQYLFALPRGDYVVELFFIEPWYGTGAGLDCAGWRVFDVSVNGEAVIKNLDLWREAGRARAIKKTVTVQVVDGPLRISFPHIAAGQAVISAIAISSKADLPTPTQLPGAIELTQAPAGFTVESHLDTGDRQYSDREGTFTKLPSELLEADWIRTADAAGTLSSDAILHLKLNSDSEVWVAHDERIVTNPTWLSSWEHTALTLTSNAAADTQFTLYRKHIARGSEVTLGANGRGGAMYSVFVTQTPPPSPPQFITLDESSSNWSAIGHVNLGVRLGENGNSLSRFPENLSDSDLLMPTKANSVPASVTFTVNDHVEIFGAFPSGSANALDWIETNQTATTSDDVTYKLYRRRVAANTRLVFSANTSLPRFAFIRAVRPSATYPLHVLANGIPEWTIHVGVGDRYGLNFRYRNTTGQPVRTTLEIIQKDGSTLRTDPIEFFSTPAGTDWSILRVRTGASINAGTYNLRLNVPESASLQLNTLEVE